MEKTYIKFQKSKLTSHPPLPSGGGRHTQKVLLTIVLLIGLTSAMIGMAVPCAFPDLFLQTHPTPGDELAGVPDVRQSNEDRSAAAALQAVMAFYGLDRGEQEWQEAIGPTKGVDEMTDAMAHAARTEGFEAEVEREIGTDELTALVMTGVPAIIPLNGEEYVVVVEIEDGGIVLEDPAVLGGRTHLKTEELIARWTDGTAVVIRSTTRD
ncbi:hypothetical protein E2N92_08145 [Methanofollis formosanus]|uniref:Peptidase C39 domain-containing protein n=1 Tax=Methanofollis formosanus TaxID=299308 RepID=A0A8G1A1E7_9EURY|nr:cysteine peptidase family C39 domain-containing protein [Methanofollis formosanus]QYZ79402.1 hypothetical protein E2N92_08145 [Methanofollis formosanus]